MSVESLSNADKQSKEPKEDRKNTSGVPELRSPRTLTDRPFISQTAPEDVGLSRPSLGLQDNENSMISAAVDPVALVTTECITVTSALRKHARWAQSSVSAILGGASFTGSRETYQKPEHTRQPSGSRAAGSRSVSLSNGVSGDDDSITSRWGLRGKKGKSMQDDPLLSAFARLRNDLRGCIDIRTFDIPSLLHPFLQVIRSSSTSAPITSLALVAITKFFAYNVIYKDSPRLSMGMQLLSAAVTHCRFQASDSAADETVLLRILRIMEGMLSGPGGELLGDESVCEMMETGLSMCCQVRLSELLRRSAEISMSAMCQVVFERLKSLETEAGDNVEAMDADSKDASSPLKLEPSVDGNSVVKGDAESSRPSTEVDRKGETQRNIDDKPSSLSSEVPPENGEDPAPPKGTSAIDLPLQTRYSSEETTIKPYGLPSIRELFRVLVDLLQPHNRQRGDAMRIMALRIIDVALEVAGPSIAKHPSLANLAKDDLCRHLFQLVRSENMNLLNESLRVAGTLLATCRGVLKLQQELFLSYLVACLHPRVEIPTEPGIDPALYDGVPQAPKLARPPASQSTSGRSTPVPVKDRQKLGMEGGSRKPDAREAMVESIGGLARIPSFLVELFINYDCEVDRGDLCEDLIGLLARNAFPDSATWSTTNVPPLCLDSLLGYVHFVSERLDLDPRFFGYPDRSKLREQRARKKLVVRGATKFNENPKSGISYLASQAIIDDPDNAHSVTRFLKGTTRISKAVLGDFLSKKSNDRFLRAFLDLFDFNGKRVDEALRDLLNSFRLPGEAPLIERIVEVFSEKYCEETTPKGIAGKDAVHVLAYAIIILNTDQHNPSLKDEKRMTYNDFAKNLRGVNGGDNFAPEYLQQIYDSIKTNEIILPEEHNNKQAFDYAWEELLLKTQSAGDLVLCETNIFDADMFQATWKPIVATLSYVFMSASDDVVFSRVITGFAECSQIAATYGLTEVIDRIIFCLGSMSTIAFDGSSNTTLNTEVQRGKDSVMVSELAVKLGRDFRAKLATYVLFNYVILGHELYVKNGWKQIVRIWLNLFINSLLPPRFSDAQDILGISSIPLQTPSQVIDRAERPAEAGFFQSVFSTISSYTADDPPEPSEEELESTLRTVDCIKECNMGVIFANILMLPPQTLKPLVSAFLEQLPQVSSPVVIMVKPDRPSSPPSRTTGHRGKAHGPAYDPSLVFILELVTVIAIRDQHTIASVGESVADTLQNIVRDSVNVHITALSRAVYCLLRLLNASQDHSFVRAPLVLHTISGFEPPKLARAALPILRGFTICLRESGPLRNEILNIPDFWSTIDRIHTIPEAVGAVFELLLSVVERDSSAVTADNYEFAVGLLNSFANAKTLTPAVEQKHDPNARKQKSMKQVKARNDEIIERAVKAVSLIYQLTGRVPALIEKSHLERNEAWITYWSPIFQALRSQCENPSREVRQQALSYLQRSLQSPELASADHQEWTAIFGEVLFPLNTRLLKPEVYQSDPAGMSETRVRAATLLCKIFLHYLVLLSEWDGMLDLWLKILDIMDRLMNSGQGDSLEEAVPESLKNILLVMSNGSFLVPPAAGEKGSEIWEETWKRVDRFLPGLHKEIFPNAAPEPKGEHQSSQPVQPMLEKEPREKPAAAAQ